MSLLVRPVHRGPPAAVPCSIVLDVELPPTTRRQHGTTPSRRALFPRLLPCTTVYLPLSDVEGLAARTCCRCTAPGRLNDRSSAADCVVDELASGSWTACGRFVRRDRQPAPRPGAGRLGRGLPWTALLSWLSRRTRLVLASSGSAKNDRLKAQLAPAMVQRPMAQVPGDAGQPARTVFADFGYRHAQELEPGAAQMSSASDSSTCRTGPKSALSWWTTIAGSRRPRPGPDPLYEDLYCAPRRYGEPLHQASTDQLALFADRTQSVPPCGPIRRAAPSRTVSDPTTVAYQIPRLHALRSRGILRVRQTRQPDSDGDECDDRCTPTGFPQGRRPICSCHPHSCV